MDGSEKRHPIIIGRSVTQQCMKQYNIITKQMPVDYYTNYPTAWMRGEIFHTILSNWNRELVMKGRTIVLFIDNAGCHAVKVLKLQCTISPSQYHQQAAAFRPMYYSRYEDQIQEESDRQIPTQNADRYLLKMQ